MSKSCVVILDPRGVILRGGQDVILRHAVYAQHISKGVSFDKLSLVIFSAGKERKSVSSNSELSIERRSKSTFNSIKFVKKAANIVKSKNLVVKLLVVGDPWESFWSAYFLNKFCSRNVPIQIQLHGDIANPAWKRINLRNRIRFNKLYSIE